LALQVYAHKAVEAAVIAELLKADSKAVPEFAANQAVSTQELRMAGNQQQQQQTCPA
jgi:hypothetical protein